MSGELSHSADVFSFGSESFGTGLNLESKTVGYCKDIDTLKPPEKDRLLKRLTDLIVEMPQEHVNWHQWESVQRMMRSRTSYELGSEGADLEDARNLSENNAQTWGQSVKQNNMKGDQVHVGAL